MLSAASCSCNVPVTEETETVFVSEDGVFPIFVKSTTLPFNCCGESLITETCMALGVWFDKANDPATYRLPLYSSKNVDCVESCVSIKFPEGASNRTYALLLLRIWYNGGRSFMSHDPLFSLLLENVNI